VNDYLENRPNLSLVFALIDSRLAPQAIDLEFAEWLVRHAVPFVFVFTKTDKVSAVTAKTNMAAFSDRISAWFEKPPAVFMCSAATRQGRHELLGVIDEEMAAINSAFAPLTRLSVPATLPLLGAGFHNRSDKRIVR
jgi:GTP-binding protein